MKVYDTDIRKILKDNFSKTKWYSEDPTALIIDELVVCKGVSRVDVAVINGKLHGYEIKSEQDTLERLPMQIKSYNKVFDTMTVVVSEKHLKKVSEIVPEWWGIKVVIHNKKSLRLKTIRRDKSNKKVDPFCLAQLLWREEAIDILEKYNLIDGLKYQPRKVLWEKLSPSIPIKDLKNEVREKIKNRKHWRVQI